MSIIKMKLIFATGNKHKAIEVQKILKEYDIEIGQVKCDYPEDHSKTVQEIAAAGAKHCAEELKLPVFVDDTGIFFTACKDYPGNAPKAVFETDSYEGLLKSVEGRDRHAYFLCVIAYCKPGQEPMIFEGILHGTITEQVHDRDADVMPYERIFMPEGMQKTLSKLSREEKNKISHRAIATRKLGEYLKSK
jgi:XTP/dITP diphosphohydrolase